MRSWSFGGAALTLDPLRPNGSYNVAAEPQSRRAAERRISPASSDSRFRIRLHRWAHNTFSLWPNPGQIDRQAIASSRGGAQI